MLNRKQLLLSLGILVTGEMTGSILRVLHPAWRLWRSAAVLRAASLTGGDFGTVTRETLWFELLWLVMFAVTGMTPGAIPAAGILLFLHGAALGGSLAGLYSGQAVTGVMTAAVFLMPHVCAFTAVLLLAARESARAGQRNSQKRQYALRYAVLIVGISLLACLHGVWLGQVYPEVLRWLTHE